MRQLSSALSLVVLGKHAQDLFASRPRLRSRSVAPPAPPGHRTGISVFVRWRRARLFQGPPLGTACNNVAAACLAAHLVHHSFVRSRRAEALPGFSELQPLGQFVALVSHIYGAVELRVGSVPPDLSGMLQRALRHRQWEPSLSRGSALAVKPFCMGAHDCRAAMAILLMVVVAIMVGLVSSGRPLCVLCQTECL